MSEVDRNIPQRPAWAARDPGELADYFFFHSDGQLRPFADNAVRIGEAMVSVVQELRSRLGNSQDDSAIRFRLPLKAGGVGRKIYKRDMGQAQTDLLEGIYEMTNAEQKTPDLDTENPIGRVWRTGSFAVDGRYYPMNFIETHGKDKRGEFLKVHLVTDVPDSLMPGYRKDQKPFATSKEVEAQVLDLYAELSEEDLVQRWISSEAA